jgi:hypothetical protein
MTRSAAAKATAAADAVLAWLRDQPAPVFPAARRGAHDAVPAAPPPSAKAAMGPPAAEAGPAADRPDPAPAARLPEVAEPSGDRRAPSSRQALAPGAGGGKTGDAPLRLSHTDWLHHRLTVTGPAAELAAFQAPWQRDPDRLAEEFLHLLVAPSPPHQRRLSLAGARILAGQLRDAIARRHDLAVARVGRSSETPDLSGWEDPPRVVRGDAAPVLSVDGVEGPLDSTGCWRWCGPGKLTWRSCRSRR